MSSLTPAVFPPSVPLSTLWLLYGAHRVCGGMWVGAKAWLSVCVQGVFWGWAGLAEEVWVSLQSGRHSGTRPRVGECVSVGVSVLSGLGVGVSCFVWILPPAPVPAPPPSAGTACLLSLSATGASLACSWNLERRRRKRQADRPPTL